MKSAAGVLGGLSVCALLTLEGLQEKMTSGLMALDVPLAAQTAQRPPARTLVLKNFTLIDGNGGAPAQNAALIVEGGRISWVGPASQLKAPAGADVQDL